MSVTQRVQKYLKFVGAAEHAMGKDGNIQGPLREALFHKKFDFEEDTLDTAHWDVSVNNGGACAINAAANGTVRLTVNTGADDNCAELCESTAIWYGQQAPIAEFRLKVDNIATVGVCVGLVDAYINTDDQIKFEMVADEVTDRGTTPDAVAFLFDTDATTDKWWCVSSKAGTEQELAAGSASAPVNTVYEVLRIEVDTSGNASFYRNGVPEGHIASAVTAAHAYKLYAGLITRGAAAARNLDIDYIEGWQNRAETTSVIW